MEKIWCEKCKKFAVKIQKFWCKKWKKFGVKNATNLL